ncbi:hypothetical protein CBS115989_7314 [Aspergillus niger]|nr:hypothetical protein CBS115989_7314 [Aspergillus niger]KAI2857941.1 hypothetical protein CBS11232_2953 [Aspergillus niger]KAI2874366.1 hypothetical protein CBS115988_6288 [Aspergillus niger]
MWAGPTSIVGLPFTHSPSTSTFSPQTCPPVLVEVQGRFRHDSHSLLFFDWLGSCPDRPRWWKETSFPPSGILPLPPQRQVLHIESHEPIVLTIVFPYGDLRFPDMCRLSFWACVKWDL